MKPRLAKEFRPLLLPWSVAALAAAGYLVAFEDPVFAKGEFGSFLIGLAGVGFVVGVLVLSALPLGFELQDRTLLLLFSQPADRRRLWREKLNAATFSVLALTLVHGGASAATGHLSSVHVLLYAAFAVTAVCSVGYHTLAARSVLVGIASAIATPLAIVLGVHLFLYFVLGLRVQLSEEDTIGLTIIGCTAYSAFSLWFGRRQFTTLELKDAGVPRGAQIPEMLVPRKLTEFFSAQPRGAITNLIRKEICLQKPIFLVSAIFTACWIFTLGVMVLSPEWQSHCVAVLNVLTGTQIVLMVILTGCVSLGDDKALGTTAWHLTLPISARRQWFIKLMVAAATAVAMAVVLPTLLAALTLLKARVGLLALPLEGLEDALGFATTGVVVFVMSFWSASMVANTVRAALTAVLTGAGLGTVAMLGVWSAGKLGGLQTGLLTSLIARYQWLPYSLDGVISIIHIAFCLGAIAMLIALSQSFRQFRRAQSGSTTFFRCATSLALVVFAIAFWIADINLSISNQRSQRFSSALVPEVTAALRSVTLQDFELPEGHVRKLTPQDLNTTLLSNLAKLWLRNSTIQVRWNESESKHFANLRVYVGEIHLPKGAVVPLSWTVPDLPQTQPPKEKP